MQKIGLIAGNRRFPIIFSREARKKGISVVAVAIKKDTLPELKQSVDKIYWLALSEFSRLFEIFKQEGITQVVMAGQISPWRLFSKEVEKDSRLKAILSGIQDKRADTIFGAIVKELQASGLELLDSTTFLEDFLPGKGTLTGIQPDFSAWEDIYFGMELAKEVAYLDIGQTVAVRNKAIVGVEALEGTDNLIRRAGKITGGGFILVKVSKPKQDLRFDIPVVGMNTLKTLVKARAACLAIEAKKTLFLDKEESIRLAEKSGISIVAV